jgi:hypothetical protein
MSNTNGRSLHLNKHNANNLQYTISTIYDTDDTNWYSRYHWEPNSWYSSDDDYYTVRSLTNYYSKKRRIVTRVCVNESRSIIVLFWSCGVGQIQFVFCDTLNNKWKLVNIELPTSVVSFSQNPMFLYNHSSGMLYCHGTICLQLYMIPVFENFIRNALNNSIQKVDSNLYAMEGHQPLFNVYYGPERTRVNFRPCHKSIHCDDALVKIREADDLWTLSTNNVSYSQPYTVLADHLIVFATAAQNFIIQNTITFTDTIMNGDQNIFKNKTIEDICKIDNKRFLILAMTKRRAKYWVI